MPADRFTKVFPKVKLDQFIRQYNLIDVPKAFTFEAPIFMPTF